MRQRWVSKMTNSTNVENSNQLPVLENIVKRDEFWPPMFRIGQRSWPEILETEFIETVARYKFRASRRLTYCLVWPVQKKLKVWTFGDSENLKAITSLLAGVFPDVTLLVAGVFQDVTLLVVEAFPDVTLLVVGAFPDVTLLVAGAFQDVTLLVAGAFQDVTLLVGVVWYFRMWRYWLWGYFRMWRYWLWGHFRMWRYWLWGHFRMWRYWLWGHFRMWRYWLVRCGISGCDVPDFVTLPVGV